MKIFIITLISVFVTSGVSLVGILTIWLNRDKLKKILIFLVSFAVGGLFGDAFIHLIPESFVQLGVNLSVSLYIIAGIIIFFALEKFIRWRHCHIPTSTNHPHPVAMMNLVGDGAHNLIDGMLIGASYLVSIPLGVTTTLAVILHEIPQEIGDFGILLRAGYSLKKALFYNFLSALLATLGAVISLIIGPRLGNYSLLMVPLTAGGFIYIAGADLIPELHRECKISTSIWQFISLLAGIGIMILLK